MKLIVDTSADSIEVHRGGCVERFRLYSKRGLETLSELWIKAQWNELHWQSISWHGFPIWQLPEDLLRLQEVIFRLEPDVIVETGVYRGGSAVFFASLCRLAGKGRVICVDIQIPQFVREAIGGSHYGDLITLIEGDSAAPETVGQVQDLIGKHDKTFFFLDSDHSKAHVLRELKAYSGMVSIGSYIVAADGVMQILHDVPKGVSGWYYDNPGAAAREFVRTVPNFVIEKPEALYGNEYVIERMTYWPDAWLRRVG